MRCASCGSEVPTGARFCPTCGSSVGIGGEERRIVTVLFADMVGFTAFSEHADPEQVKRRVDGCFSQLTHDITSFGGVVDKIVGDEIVALFGAPTAHEDDAERAVRAGLRMQETLREMATFAEPAIEMRIGINTGEVLVGSSASGRDYTAMGDVMNTASRLQTMAPPGEVLVGGSTYAATNEAIAYEALGLLNARGRSGQVEAWVARSAIRPPGFRQRRSAAFVGRQRELALLRAQASLAFEQSQAQVSVLFGAAGMGKTRLAEELASGLVVSHGALVLRGHCVPYGEANVWWPIAEALRQIFGLDQDDALPVVEGTVRAWLVEHLDEDPSANERLVVAALHALGHRTVLRDGDRLQNRSEVTLVVTRVLESVVRERPVVVLLSDLHWSGEAVWDLVHHLLDQLSRCPLMVVLTARRTDEDHRRDGRFGALRLELGPLPTEAARELVAELGLDMSSAEVDELLERSGGNPFFLEELGGLVNQAQADPIEGPRLDRIPGTLRGLLAARIDQLSPIGRRTLEAAALLGRSGPIENVGLLLQVRGDDADVAAGMTELVDSDIVVLDGQRFAFVSDLTREVAYGTMTKSSRAESHEVIARYLEKERGPNYRNATVAAIAHHYEAAARLANDLDAGTPESRADLCERAIRWVEDAGARALAAGVASEAEAWYSAGIELAGPEQVAEMLFGRAQARAEQRNIAGTRADLDLLASFDVDDPLIKAKALIVRGEVDSWAGELNRAVLGLTEGIKQLHGLGRAAEEAAALRKLGQTDMLRGDDDAARSSLELARRVASEAGERRQEAWAYQGLAWQAYSTGAIAEASGFVGQAAELFSELDDRAGLAWTMGIDAWVAFHRGDWDRAAKLVEEVLPETRRSGDPWAEAVMLILKASMQLWSGRGSDAVDLADEARHAALRANDAFQVVQARAIQGRALINRGRVSEGREVLDQAATAADQAGHEEARRVAMIANAVALAGLGEADLALHWADRLEAAGLRDASLGSHDLSVAIVQATLQRGDIDEAVRRFEQAFPEIDGEASALDLNFALAIGAVVAAASGDFATAEERAGRVLAGRSTYLDRISAHLGLAIGWAKRGQGNGVVDSIATARRELIGTDDVVTPHLVNLVEALCLGQGREAAEARLRSLSIDPTGWSRGWTSALGLMADAEAPQD